MNKKLVVQVRFTEIQPGTYANPKIYNFLTNISTLQQGDRVVVDTVNGYQVASVIGYAQQDAEFGETFGNKNAKWVIQKVELQEHIERLQAEKRREELMKKMEVRRKKAEKLEVYRILAQADPEMATLLEEFQNLEV